MVDRQAAPRREQTAESDVTATAPRRSHRKSRAGCLNCKRRRVKCDEGKPACRNCTQRSLRCQFDTSDGEIHKGPRNAFVFSRYQSTVKSTPEALESRSGSPITPRDSLTTSSTLVPGMSSSQIGFEDLELLHHYDTTASHTFGDVNDDFFWQTRLPAIGLAHPFAMHLILALSALHLAHIQPTRKEYYITRAVQHHTIGLSIVSPLVAKLNAENCEAVYISATLVCFYHFALGPQKGDYLAFSEDGPPVWLSLLNGVKQIATTKEILLEAKPPAPDHADGHGDASEGDEALDYTNRLGQLREFITEEAGASVDIYLAPLDRLQSSSTTVLRASCDENNGHNPYGYLVFAWLYTLSEDFEVLLQSRDPLALVVYAHYTVLLKELQSRWFMKGWAEHVIMGIKGYVSGRYREWVEWPWIQIYGSELTEERM